MAADYPSTGAPQYVVAEQCDAYLAAHGDNHRGVGWPHYADAQARYQVMLDGLLAAVPPGQPVRVLDFGCGLGLFGEFLRQRQVPHVSYAGLDLSARQLALARRRLPEATFYQLDVLQDPTALPTFDFIVLNGIFTQKCSVGFDEFWDYCQRVLRVLWPRTTYGLAFNAQTKLVDWERDDLFHLPLEVAAAFLRRELSRHFAFRHDYGLYEFTTYVYKTPRRPQ